MLPAKSLIYAAGRIEVPELDRIREQLECKYGKEFVEVNSEVGRTGVDPSLVVKLSIRTPDAKLMNQYLAAIAQIFGVAWQPPVDPDRPLPPQTTSPVHPPIEKPISPTINDDRPPPYSPQLTHIPPHSSSMDESAGPSSPTSQNASENNGIPDFDELQRRFQALRKN